MRQPIPIIFFRSGPMQSLSERFEAIITSKAWENTKTALNVFSIFFNTQKQLKRLFNFIEIQTCSKMWDPSVFKLEISSKTFSPFFKTKKQLKKMFLILSNLKRVWKFLFQVFPNPQSCSKTCFLFQNLKKLQDMFYIFPHKMKNNSKTCFAIFPNLKSGWKRVFIF